MRVLALDYGSRRIGVALSDPTGTLARPLPFLESQSDARLARQVAALATREEAALILLGLPRKMDGTLGEAAGKVELFAVALRSATSIPVKLVDERLSTVQASRQLQEAGKDARAQKSKIDSEAAAVLLQSYLDAQGFPSAGP
jgi:putative Holliday junction resolvase